MHVCVTAKAFEHEITKHTRNEWKRIKPNYGTIQMAAFHSQKIGGDQSGSLRFAR